MSYGLTVEPLGQTVEVRAGQTILDACLRAGLWLPHACGHGLCGSCKISVLEGEYDHGSASPFALMDFEREEGRALACTCTLNSDLTIEAEIDDDPDARIVPVRDFIGKVERIDRLTHDVKRINLTLPEPIAFQAGQYINVSVPGAIGSRAFSLANPPSAGDRIELHVRLAPGGKATGYLHHRLQPGDSLAFSGPYGRFFVRKSFVQPILFLAGGTGLSSPKSMILDLLAEGWSAPITLIHGVRARRDLYDEEVFHALAERHERFTYLPVLSALEDGEAWAGERGFVHEAAIRHFKGQFAGMKAYLCGPPPMIEACLLALMQGRLFERDIYTERFLSQADAANKVRSPVFRRI